jgi:hypothetical protein
MDAAMDYCRQIVVDMDFNKRHFKAKLPIRLLAVGGEHSIPNMGEALRPYFENVTPLVVAQSAISFRKNSLSCSPRRCGCFSTAERHDEPGGKMGHDDRGAGRRRQ